MKKVRAPSRPTLTLTPDDARELHALSADLERELLRAYDDFCDRDNRQVDDQRWKHVKSQEDVHVYRERTSFRQPAHSLHSRGKASDITLEIGPQAALAANSTMPVLMGTGILPGSIIDALYGTSFYDTRSLRARNSYTKETMEENAVLAVVEGPNHEDPFHFLGVVWYLKVFPIPGLMSKRDFIMVASSHMSLLPNGERVAIVLFHSIQHRDAPVRRDLNILRADVSVATLYRQLDDMRYEVFMTTFVDAKGSTPDALFYAESAKSMLTVTGMSDVALRRKLFFRMREKNRHRSPSSASSSASREEERACALCNKSIGRLFSASGSNCQICSKRVCPKCSITKQIVIESNRTNYTSMPFDFCLVCTLETKEIPSLTIAREEAYERSLRPRNPLSSSLSSSSSIDS